MMLVLYNPLSAEEIREAAKGAISGVTKWFAENPKRRICRVEGWYGKFVRVRRKYVEQDINKAADVAVAQSIRRS